MPQIVQICSNQVKLRVEFTLSTPMAKDPSMSIVICAPTAEDGPCLKEGEMARLTSIRDGTITNQALVS